MAEGFAVNTRRVFDEVCILAYYFKKQNHYLININKITDFEYKPFSGRQMESLNVPIAGLRFHSIIDL